MLPKFPQVLSILAAVAVLSTFFITRSAAKDSLSPVLNTRIIPGLIAVGYLSLGLIATGAGYIAHVLIYPTSLSLSLRDALVGVNIGLIFGFLILFYYDRYEIETSGDNPRFKEASGELLENYEYLEKSDLPPIKLTEAYNALEDSVRETAEILDNSTTRDGIVLAKDMDQWVGQFSKKSGPAKGRIVGNSETPQQEELKDRRQEINSIIKRVRRIANQ
jgi:hypothetical protein